MASQSERLPTGLTGEQRQILRTHYDTLCVHYKRYDAIQPPPNPSVLNDVGLYAHEQYELEGKFQAALNRLHLITTAKRDQPIGLGAFPLVIRDLRETARIAERCYERPWASDLAQKYCKRLLSQIDAIVPVLEKTEQQLKDQKGRDDYAAFNTARSDRLFEETAGPLLAPYTRSADMIKARTLTRDTEGAGPKVAEFIAYLEMLERGGHVSRKEQNHYGLHRYETITERPLLPLLSIVRRYAGRVTLDIQALHELQRLGPSGQHKILIQAFNAGVLRPSDIDRVERLFHITVHKPEATLTGEPNPNASYTVSNTVDLTVSAHFDSVDRYSAFRSPGAGDVEVHGLGKKIEGGKPNQYPMIKGHYRPGDDEGPQPARRGWSSHAEDINRHRKKDDDRPIMDGFGRNR